MINSFKTAYPRQLVEVDGCLAIFSRGKVHKGPKYAHTLYYGVRWGGHRLSYHLNCEPVDPGELILHKCHRKWCVRPDHLYKGDKSQNAKDFWATEEGQRAREHLSRMHKGRRIGINVRRAA